MNSNEYSPCDYVNRVQDNQPKPQTRAYFETLLDDMNVSMLTDKVREHRPDAERYKTQLPAITWQARFGGKLRTHANAEPTGLFCLDVDFHHSQTFRDICKEKGADEAWRWGGQLARTKALEWAQLQTAQDENPGLVTPANDLSIAAIHISPQGAGVHVVATCSSFCKTIEENQRRLARLLGVLDDAADYVCHDWPRIFFIAPREDWTYIDKETLFGE